MPSDTILFPRRMFYVEAVLYLVVAVVAFTLGYFVGRGSATPDKPTQEQVEAANRVPVLGRVIYDPGLGRSVGDEGAVVIALPADKFPDPRLGSEGFVPFGLQSKENPRDLPALQQLGGAYARANEAGDFSLFVPGRGKYRFLIVSRHATRLGESSPDSGEIADMEKYFDRAQPVIRSFKYRWMLKEITADAGPIDVDFGPNG
jgi:hypothetical protein